MKKVKSVVKNIVNWIKDHWKLVLIIIIGLVLIAGWQINNSRKNAPQLTFEAPQYRDLTKTLEVSGIVDAKEKARLRFMTGGKVTYLGAQEGQAVKKWQTIASIDKATLQKQLEQDLNAYMKERWDWENTRDDIEDRWLDDTEQRTVDKEQWDLENEVLDVEIRTQAIHNSSIYSPFEGVLTQSPTAVAGVQLLATDYFEVVNPQSIIFKAAIDEADISDVQLGQSAEIELDAYQNQYFDTTVNYISYTSNQSSSGTVFIVELPISNPNLDTFRLGMNGDVQIVLEKKENVLSIPFEATRERDGKIFVDIKEDGKTYQEKEIEVGLETEDYIEVISGLSENDQILIPE